MKNIKKIMAFTLAETLIVMGIIGVVAALTVPNLNASTGEKEKVAKVKKIYKDLNDAYGRATAVYGPVDEWFAKDTTSAAQATRFAERMLDFMKASKVCGINTGCFSNQKLLDIHGSTIDSNYESVLKGANYYMIITSDGTSIAFFAAKNSRARIRVDIDGPNKGKNKAGEDIFNFIIGDDDILYPNAIEASSATGTNYENYETAWVIQNGNMDYLKVDSSDKCPNGTVLSWTNTTCK